MPTIRYRSHKRVVADLVELSKWQEWALLAAGPIAGALLARWPADDASPWRDAWEGHGARLLEAWIEAHPGSRPWAWWVFEHGKERPIIVTGLHPSVREEFGFFGILCAPDFGGWQEPEPSYLARLGLLTAAEREILGRNERSNGFHN